MAIFIKTNDITSEIDDIFDGETVTDLNLPTDANGRVLTDFWFTGNGKTAEYYYVVFNNKLHMFKTISAAAQSSSGHYCLQSDFHNIYDFSTNTWEFDSNTLPSQLTSFYYKSFYIASDSNRIYFCFNGDITNVSTEGYKQYSHALYGYDFENGVIDYTNKISNSRINTQQQKYAIYASMEQWNIKNFSSNSILLNSMGMTNSSGIYGPSLTGEQKRLTLTSNIEESVISYYANGEDVSPRSDSWKFPHRLYNNGLEVWLMGGTWYKRKNNVTESYWTGANLTPVAGTYYDMLYSATFLKDQLHLFYVNRPFGKAANSKGYYKYTRITNDTASNKYILEDGDTTKVDGVHKYVSGQTGSKTLYYTFEHDGDLYTMSRGDAGAAHFRKIYSRKEQTFNDGTHGKIKGIWVKIKKTVKNANGNYEMVEEFKRVTDVWIKTGNTYNKVLW